MEEKGIDKEPENGDKTPDSNDGSKSRKAFSKVRRELTEEELNSPAVQKLLIEELEKNEIKSLQLEKYQENFHKVDKDNAILTEKLKNLNSSEILYSFTLTIGSAIIGLAPTFWTTGYGWIILAVGSLLIVGGLLSKRAKK